VSDVETTTVDFRISLVNNIRGAEVPGGVVLAIHDEGFHGLTFVPNVHLEQTKESRPQIGTLWELKQGNPANDT
jgi:hypothetical protein